MSESKEHQLSKVRAKEWLYSRGCIVTRTEVPFLDGRLRIDVVGFRDGKPVIGIECGNIWHNGKELYKRLSFPVFQLQYLIEPKDFGDKIEPCMGKPNRHSIVKFYK